MHTFHDNYYLNTYFNISVRTKVYKVVKLKVFFIILSFIKFDNVLWSYTYIYERR